MNWKIAFLDRQTADGFVTTAHWTCTYADGSFCVPCVLMAC